MFTWKGFEEQGHFKYPFKGLDRSPSYLGPGKHQSKGTVEGK